jgi:hypothetical protein
MRELAFCSAAVVQHMASDVCIAARREPLARARSRMGKLASGTCNASGRSKI